MSHARHMGTERVRRENLAGSLHKWFRIAEKQNNLDPKARARTTGMNHIDQ